MFPAESCSRVDPAKDQTMIDCHAKNISRRNVGFPARLVALM